MTCSSVLPKLLFQCSCAPLVDLVSGIFDYSDVIEFGSMICQCTADEFIEYAKDGLDMMKDNIDPAVEVALKQMGYDLGTTQY